MATHPQVPTAPRARAKILLVSTLLTLVFAIASPARARASAGQPSARPNVLLIVTDDQRWDTLRAMPAVERRIAAKGTTFTNGFVVNPLCCPSRASILTGDYSHTTGVYREITPYGRFEALKDSSTIATWLHDAGYTTGLFGKYIDGYQHPALTGYVPPGWDRWVAFVRSTYYDYMLTVDGRIESHGAAPQDYSTNVLARYATDFIRSTQGPLFVEFATAAPHAPAIAPPGQDPQTFADLPPWRPPSYDEADTSDKPAYVRNLPPLTANATAAIDAFRRDQYRTLLDVDRQVGALLDALRATGRLSNTVIIYTSDNGLLWGEHRWSKKEVPYEEAIRVPLLVRYDAFPSQPLTDDHLALNIDIAPTIADLTGVPAPPMDGQSLRPLLDGGGAPWRTDFLIEHMEGFNPVPTYCAVRTATDILVWYGPTGEREYYDLVRDPYELDNIVNDPAVASRVSLLTDRLDTLCVPRPPGFIPYPTARLAIALVLLFALFAIPGVVVRRRNAHSSLEETTAKGSTWYSR